MAGFALTRLAMRIVTLNTWKGEGAYRHRLALIAAGLTRLTPDVVCLQEALCTPDGRLDTAGHLARGLGLNLARVQARLKRRRVEDRVRRCFSGLTILSRYPIARHGEIMLPSHPRDPGRFAHWIDIAAGARRWRVVNLHLTHIRDADRFRHQQLSVLLTDLHRDPGAPDRVWLCGDFNATLATAAMRALAEQNDWRVADAYLTGGGRLPGNTFPVPGNRFDAQRIDRILMLTRSGIRAPVCREAAVVLDTPDKDGIYPSDHGGVMIVVDDKHGTL